MHGLLGRWRDARARARRLRTRHVHVVRESDRGYNWAFFRWLARRHPDDAARVRVSTVDEAERAPVGGAALLLPWVQDPVAERDAVLFERMQAIEERHRHAGARIVNPVASVSSAIKSRALATLRGCGLRAARTARVDRATPFAALADALGMPFLVRGDRGHGGTIARVATPDELARVPWETLAHPVALEFIDTRGRDGLYRKTRTFFTGSRGIVRHLVVSRSWCVHAADRVRTRAALEEELAHLARPDTPHHEDLDRARRALGLDVVAFDHSLDREGRLVVWEPNPFPTLWAPFNERDPYYAYQRERVDAVFEQLRRYVLGRAGLVA